MKKKHRSGTVDFGTTEMAQRLRVVPALTRGDFGYNGKVVDETEIDRLLLEDRITPSDHSSLERLLRILLKANFNPLRSPVYEAPVSADPSLVGDRRANQIRAVASLFARLDQDMGRIARVNLVNLVLMDQPWSGSDDDLRSKIHRLERVMGG